MDLKSTVYNPEQFRMQGHQLVDLLADYLTSQLSAEEKTVLDYTLPDEMLADWMTDDSVDALTFFEKLLRQSIRLHHPGYMGHQVTPSAPVSALAGFLGLFLNNGGAIYEMAPAASALERWVIHTFRSYFGLFEADGILTSGGTIANLTALICARNCKAPNNVWQEGQHEKYAFLVSSEAHYCIDRAVRIMGWGSEGIISVPVDQEFRMQTDLLAEEYRKALQRGIQVLGVVGSAPSTSTGKFDDLVAIGQFCRKNNLWFHIDGAHGGPAAFSPTFRHLMQGAEMADSITVDAHKMMLVPALTTMLFFRNAGDSYKTFAQQAHYLWHADEEEWYNYGKRTMECTKLMMSARIAILYKLYGMDAFVSNVDQCFTLARQMAEAIMERKALELAVYPDSNIVCFRYIACSSERKSVVNSQIRQQILTEGTFYIVKTVLHGETWLRVSLMNPVTTMIIVEALLDKVEMIGAQTASSLE
jgi:L-2,4-diaminobutyrate decarboxylase